MGHAIVFTILGILGWLLPSGTKQQMMNQEGSEWLSERR